MPAATLEQSSKDTSPVFVAGGRRRNHAVRLAAATVGLFFAGWLVALAAGLIGFSPLPELALPGTGGAQTGPASPGLGSQPAGEREADAHVSSIASRPERGGEQAGSATSRSARASGTGTGFAGGQAGSAGSGAGSPSPGTGGAPPSQTTPPAAGHPTPASSGHAPSFTPPASGEKSATPPRGNSANAPGRVNSVNTLGKSNSANPPGGATRAYSD